MEGSGLSGDLANSGHPGSAQPGCLYLFLPLHFFVVRRVPVSLCPLVLPQLCNKDGPGFRPFILCSWVAMASAFSSKGSLST